MPAFARQSLLRILLFLCVFHESTASADPPVAFEDKTAARGLDQLPNIAACWADFNNDHWTDLCAGGVWLNEKGQRFTKTIAVPGSCVAADFDNDGFVDLFSWSALKLFRNQNGAGFAEIPLPELPPCVSRGACWGDFNGDAYVDLFVGGYEDWDKGITYPDLILMNEKGKSFRLARSESRFRARGITACDFDQDGDIDVYVSNYRLQPNRLWVNDGLGQFQDLAKKHGVIATNDGFAGGHSIGAVWGDFDSDGLMDLFAGNFAHRDARGNQPESRFLNNLGPANGFKFQDKGTCGVHYQESYASPCSGDYDNDGQLDLFLTTVYGTASFGRKNHPALFQNKGGFEFRDATAESRIDKLPPTYQAAWADFDNDGDLDLATAGRLFENQGAPGNWIRVHLEGDGEVVNRSAIGTQVRIKTANTILTRQVEAGTGEGNQNDLTLHIGLGKINGPVDLEIHWPGKRRESYSKLASGQLHSFEFRAPARR